MSDMPAREDNEPWLAFELLSAWAEALTRPSRATSTEELRVEASRQRESRAVRRACDSHLTPGAGSFLEHAVGLLLAVCAISLSASFSATRAFNTSSLNRSRARAGEPSAFCNRRLDRMRERHELGVCSRLGLGHLGSERLRLLHQCLVRRATLSGSDGGG
jgi:hypothetical protein